jgi:hypothetical protein
MFQVLNKVTSGKPCATRWSSGGRRVILKALLYVIAFYFWATLHSVPATVNMGDSNESKG